ncbi:hypothetical protein QAD02_018149 [Eretmocerus hayati]|uniref:Uncharacterized protein n=1 Tax=Eretmocerus hayati TaxID=131215 RepID=A0ACC2PG85_9HYME|nr:hypothetical protein QAD02_018149 [Eretmocerus hayati]
MLVISRYTTTIGTMDFGVANSGSFGVNVNRDEYYRGKIRFCLLLHHLIPVRSYVRDVIEQSDNFISDSLIPRIVRDLEKKLNPQQFSLVKHIIEGFRNPFEAFSTEKGRFAIFRKDSIFRDPKPFKIGEKAIQTFVAGSIRASLTFGPVFAIHIPLIRALKTFFQLPGVYKAAKNYIADLDSSETITNYRQGLTWQKYYSQFAQDHEDYFDLEIFIDDLQTGNGMGSAAGVQKLCGVFARCSSLPP